MKDMDYSSYNCASLAIIAHGDAEGRLYGQHKEKNSRRKQKFSCKFEDLRKDFDGVESLAGKPKLVVVQACRGEGGEHPYYLPANEVWDIFLHENSRYYLFISKKLVLVVGF